MLRVVGPAWGVDFKSTMGYQEDKYKFVHSGTATSRGKMVFWRTVTHLKVDTQEDRELTERSSSSISLAFCQNLKCQE